MAYIWNNYYLDKDFFIDAEGSPYFEVFNAQDRHALVSITGNRLRSVFLPDDYLKNLDNKIETFDDLLCKLTEEERYKDYVNIIFHYLVRLDLSLGNGIEELLMRDLLVNIESGLYGKEFLPYWNKCPLQARSIILWYLVQYYLHEGKRNYYSDVLKSIFEIVRIYNEKSTHLVHIFLGKERTETNIIILEVVNYIFKDIGVDVRVMWENEHFGIIDVEETMFIDELALI